MTKLKSEKFGKNIIATEKLGVQNKNGTVLGNDESIVNKKA